MVYILFRDGLLICWFSIVNDAISTDVSLSSKVELVEGDDSSKRDIDACFFLSLSYCSLRVSLMHLNASARNPPFVVPLQDAEVFALLVAADDKGVSRYRKEKFQG